MPKPCHQGKADTLCAIYAVLNALRLTHGIRTLTANGIAPRPLPPGGSAARDRSRIAGGPRACASRVASRRRASACRFRPSVAAAHARKAISAPGGRTW